MVSRSRSSFWLKKGTKETKVPQQGVLGGAGGAVPGTHQLDVIDFLLLQCLDSLLRIQLQGKGQALQGLVLALHTDLCLHLQTGIALSVRVVMDQVPSPAAPG